MTAAKRKHASRVNQHAGLFFERFLERFWRKTRNARKTSQYLRPFRVQFLHHRVVVRNGRRSGEGMLGKLLDVVELKKFIVPPLVTDRAGQARADVRATRRAGAV